MSDAPTRIPIGCDGHTHVVLIDARYLRWRCTDRNCPDARRAQRRGVWLFHVHDTHTGERWNEEEPVRLQGLQVA